MAGSKTASDKRVPMVKRAILAGSSRSMTDRRLFKRLEFNKERLDEYCVMLTLQRWRQRKKILQRTTTLGLGYGWPIYTFGAQPRRQHYFHFENVCSRYPATSTICGVVVSKHQRSCFGNVRYLLLVSAADQGPVRFDFFCSNFSSSVFQNH